MSFFFSPISDQSKWISALKHCRYTAEEILAEGRGLNIYFHFLHSIKGDLFFPPCQK